MWYAWLTLVLSAVGTCAGNLLLKQASLALPNPSPLEMVASFWFMGAIACYVLDLIFFAQALQQLPVSIAVPVVSGIRIAATAILSYALFSERLTESHWFAASLITTGIVILSRTS
jgi:multidrug transporter EmrE-like cation transporter